MVEDFDLDRVMYDNIVNDQKVNDEAYKIVGERFFHHVQTTLPHRMNYITFKTLTTYTMIHSKRAFYKQDPTKAICLVPSEWDLPLG